jgi:hypothetical protein
MGRYAHSKSLALCDWLSRDDGHTTHCNQSADHVPCRKSAAMESFVNLAGAVFALWMITIAKCLSDKDHPFGHSKAL